MKIYYMTKINNAYKIMFTLTDVSQYQVAQLLENATHFTVENECFKNDTLHVIAWYDVHNRIALFIENTENTFLQDLLQYDTCTIENIDEKIVVSARKDNTIKYIAI